MKPKSIKLYNLIFPLWIAMFFPPYVFIPLIGNLIIDGAVIMLALHFNGEYLGRERLTGLIIKSWGYGFLSDLIGAGILFVMTLLGGRFEQYNVWHDVKSLLIYLIVIAIVGRIIYRFNYKLFVREPLDEKIVRRVSLAMGIITAPWMFLLPTQWFYRW